MAKPNRKRKKGGTLEAISRMRGGKSAQVARDPIQETIENIREEMQLLGESVADGLRHTARVGAYLRELKPLVSTHGSWVNWLDSHAVELGFSARQAQKYMRIAAKYPQYCAGIGSQKRTPGSFLEQGEKEPVSINEALAAVATTQPKQPDAKAERKADVVEKIRQEPAPLPDGQYRVLAMDPPWRYDARADDSTHRSRNPYPDMSMEEIKALPVAELAHEDCVLFLWTTNAFMRQAFDCLDAWGFQNKTILTWVKDRMGMGNWLRGQTEHCLMAVRGKPVVTLTNQTTALHGQLREHSRKPDEFFALVESLCPGSKLEMFARESRPGWHSWGAEVRHFDAAEQLQ